MNDGAAPGLPVPGHLPALFDTHLSLPGRRQGKVRDVYRVPASAGGVDRLLVVATDRISAFDVVMPTPIEGKGRLLTEISTRWFEWLRPRGLVADHLLSTDVADVPGLADCERESLRGRIMLCRAAQVVPIECVARGFLAGSGWAEYRVSGSVCGVPLPPGLREGDRLPEPIFTPATKADEGHDENIDFEGAAARIGAVLAARLRGPHPADLPRRGRVRGEPRRHSCGHQVRVRLRPWSNGSADGPAHAR
jgi:phosphoribosylaminoimidazole-succinocarboxamide synthase